jgi:hypothetical protein
MIRDLRKFSKQTSARLVVGFMLLLFIVGDGLIYVIYGPGSALTGLLCLVGMLVPVALIVAFLEIMDWIVKRANRD